MNDELKTVMLSLHRSSFILHRFPLAVPPVVSLILT
jgi:hypothetical protein